MNIPEWCNHPPSLLLLEKWPWWAWPIPQSGCRRNSSAMKHLLCFTGLGCFTPHRCPCPLTFPPTTPGCDNARCGEGPISPGRLKWRSSHGYLSPQLFVWNLLCFLWLTPQGDTPASNAPSNIQLSKSVTQSLTCTFFVKQTSCWIQSTKKSSAVIQLRFSTLLWANKQSWRCIHNNCIVAVIRLWTRLQVRQTFHGAQNN